MSIPVILILIVYLTPLIFLTAGVLGLPLFLLTNIIFTVCFFVYFIADLYGFLGNLHFTSADEEKASLFYKKAILNNSKSAIIYLNYAVILIKARDYESARLHLKTASGLNHNHDVDKAIILTTSNCYLAMDNPDIALELLRQAKLKYEDVGPEIEDAIEHLHYLKKLKGEDL